MTIRRLRKALIQASELAVIARHDAKDQKDADMWTIVLRIFSTLSKAIGKIS